MATSILHRLVILLITLAGNTAMFAQEKTAKAADEHYRKFYTSNVLGIDSLRQWILVNHRNPYGKNEMEAVELQTGRRMLLPQADSYTFTGAQKMVLSIADKSVMFKDLVTGTEREIEGSYVVNFLPETGKVVLHEKEKKVLLVCDTDGKTLIRRNGVQKVRVNSAHRSVLATTADVWVWLDLVSLDTKTIKTDHEAEWFDSTGDTAWGLVLKDEDVYLSEWNIAANTLTDTAISIPAGFKLPSGYGLYTEIKKDRFFILPLVKIMEEQPDLVSISYTNKNNSYKMPFRQLAVYDLEMKKWRHLPGTEDLFYIQDFINENGDFIHYDKVTSYRDTLNNVKTEITLIKNFGEKRIALRNPYFYKANYQYDTSTHKMLYFEGGKWWIHDLVTDTLSAASLPETLEWSSETYSGLSDVPQASAVPSGKKGEYIIQERYDLYLLNLGNNSSKKLTDGRQKNIRYSVYRSEHTAPTSHFPFLLKMFNMTDFHSGFAYLHANNRVETVVYGDFVVKEAWMSGKSLIYTAHAYQEPLQILRQTGKTKKIIYKSAGTAGGQLPKLRKEIFQYTLRNGKKRNAVLLYPASYDDRKKYPLVVNVYEDRTREILTYRIPHLNDGLGFNFLHYVYQGYFVLLPDLDYVPAKVGEAIVNSVVEVTNEAFKRANIDKENIAIVGSSFGGYESTLLIGTTNIFKTAVAGVAVVDLPRTALSYIKDLNRTEFWRIERQQNRLNKNLFGNWQLYLENSPVYHLPNVTRPVLLWTGSEDGNVNPDQSRAYFLGLQRLGKLGVLLEYPGEGHNILGRAKQHDLNVKIWEWLDYYLKGKKDAPWITPLIQKTVP